MGCAPCAASAAIRTARQGGGTPMIMLGQPATTPVPCEFEEQQLKIWREKLLCIKDKALYLQLNLPPYKLNSYIGVVISAINYNTNPCYFRTQLEEIAEFMAVIVNNEVC